MIQLVKNNVKYKGREDYIVEYATIGDKQYFVKDKLSNGSFIATTNLKEAINEEMNPVSYGVINSEGQEIISFDKKSIRSIEDKYLIVELSKPTSQAVIDNAALINDPLATSKLVTIRAGLKESVNNKMADDEGRFEFNDPCSEATIYDYEGNNLVNNENYSYIGKGNTGLYLRKVDDEEVQKFDFATNAISDTSKQDNVEATNISSDTVAQMPTVEEAAEVNEANEEAVQPEETVAAEEVEIPVSDAAPETPQEEAVQPEETVATEEVEIPVSDAAPETPQEEAVQPEETVATEEVEIPVSDATPETPQEEVNEEANKETLDLSSIEIDPENMEEEISNKAAKEENTFNNEFELSLNDYKAETDDSLYETTNEDKYNYDIEESSEKYKYENIEDNYYDSEYKDDSIIPSAIKTIDNLYRQNRSQKEHIEQLDDKNEKLESKIINYQDIVDKLENKIQTLEKDNHKMQDKIHDQNEIMEKQDRKIISLRESQVKQMEKQKRDEASLVNLLHEIRPALNQNTDSYEDDYEYSYGRRAA